MVWTRGVADLEGVKLLLRMPEAIKDGSTWGGWRLNASDLTMVLQSGRHHYEIDLEGITDSAQMLDWIFQLRMKAWVTDDIIGDLILAFQDLFRPQNTICGQGINKTIDAKEWLHHVIKKS